ncbi:MAG: hypothetical protein HY445_00370 [Candidatus Niyogibacteria bacterium]|nr:hypothetical protein [Candidatus Niyogibacteria bacterium]
MKIKAVSAVFLVLFLISFTGCGSIIPDLFPGSINRKELLSLPIEITPGYEIRVSFSESVEQYADLILDDADLGIDPRFDELKQCLIRKEIMLPEDVESRAQYFLDWYRVVVVSSSFKCDLHWPSCGGENWRPGFFEGEELGVIFVAWETWWGDLMPNLEEEITEVILGHAVDGGPCSPFL